MSETDIIRGNGSPKGFQEKFKVKGKLPLSRLSHKSQHYS